MRTHVGRLALCLLACSTALVAQEKKINRRDLPPAVEKTVAEQSQGATVKGFSTEVEKGARIYEVALIVDGHGKDIAMDAQGRILEIEEEVSPSALPAAVRQGLETAAGQGTLGKIETLTKRGRLVAYEAVVTKGQKHLEVQVGPDGKKLTHPE